jgi:two-component system NarL family response regulator
MNEPIRLIIADDHAMFRGGLKSLLRRHRDMPIVAEVETANALISTVKSTPCDVLLLDLQMERWALDDISELASITRILVLTASESVENAIAAMRLGARGIVHKRFAVQTLLEAIRAVAGGAVWMPPALQSEIARQWNASSSKTLTARESEIVRSVAMGQRNAEIAARLSIREATVKTHLTNIFQKLAIRDRVELTLYALRHGLVHPSPRTRNNQT